MACFTGEAVADMNVSAEVQFVTLYGQILRDADAGVVSKDVARQARRVNADLQRKIVELDTRLERLSQNETEELIALSVQKERVTFNSLQALMGLSTTSSAQAVAPDERRQNDGVMDMRLTGSNNRNSEVRVEIGAEDIATGNFE